jgi:molybdate transport system substrate-binding protein
MQASWIAALALLLPAAACGEAPGGRLGVPAPVVVFAAASLREVAIEIAAERERRGGAACRLRFDATSTLARQIAAGAPADLFLTAAPEWLDEVATIERADWLSNRLVVVVPKEAPEIDLADVAGLAGVPSLALANEQVPAGRYARAALRHLGLALPERALLGESVRDVLSKVSEGGAAAGVVYATDAAIDPKVRVASTFPAGSHPPIRYSIARLTPAGQALFDALREPWALELARRRGFVVP